MRNRTIQQMVNDEETERMALIAIGSFFLVSGIIRIRNFAATVKTIAGAYLLYRGIQGYNKTNDSLDLEDDESFISSETDI